MATQQSEGVYPFDPTTQVGQLRSLIGDKDPTPKTENGSTISGYGIYMWYSDTEIELMLARNSGNLYWVAAEILYAVALSRALLEKAWSSADLTVRGDAIAAEIRLLADRYRDRAGTVGAEAAVDYVKVVPTGGVAFPSLWGNPGDPEDCYRGGVIL